MQPYTITVSLSLGGYFVLKNTREHTDAQILLVLIPNSLEVHEKPFANQAVSLFVSDLARNRHNPVCCKDSICLYSLLVCSKCFLILFREV